MKIRLLCIFVLTFFTTSSCNEEYCYRKAECANNNAESNERYLLYDVNPPEGFNLRRDVYMRFATLAYKLQHSKNKKLENFKLVLPPWSHLYHWKYSEMAEQIPWGLYFDLNSLKSIVPVIEMYEFFDAINKTYSVVIDEVYILQHFEDMFETGNFEDRMEIEKCLKKYELNYFFYKNITSRNIKCLSYHGPATKLSELFLNTSAKIILLHHAEVALHEMFGNKLYWQIRRSMRFNKKLQEFATEFRRKFLNSSDELDNINLPENWRDEKPKRNAIGGPYLGVHLRRRDFLRGRSHQVPSIDNIAQQITKALKKHKLINVFIATDADDDEYRKIVQKVPSHYNTFKYIPSDEIKRKYRDGGIAIIEQIICSHARYFIGTYESTFSFRIQEEREILGFPTETTFNCFCKDDINCPQPSIWKIIY